MAAGPGGGCDWRAEQGMVGGRSRARQARSIDGDEPVNRWWVARLTGGRSWGGAHRRTDPPPWLPRLPQVSSTAPRARSPGVPLLLAWGRPFAPEVEEEVAPPRWLRPTDRAPVGAPPLPCSELHGQRVELGRRSRRSSRLRRPCASPASPRQHPEAGGGSGGRWRGAQEARVCLRGRARGVGRVGPRGCRRSWTALFLASIPDDGRMKEALQYTAAGVFSFISSSSQFSSRPVRVVSGRLLLRCHAPDMWGTQ
jgi:hypothetical protein